MGSEKSDESAANIGAGSQTLMRGLDILEAVSEEHLALAELSERIGLAKSTTYRLATALADRGYLAYTPRSGYRLGAQLIQLGAIAQGQTDLIQIAREHIERLSATTGDTIHMGVLDGDQALYLAKVQGSRRITISSKIGDRQPLSSTGLGKALMLDHSPEYWLDRFDRDQEAGSHPADRKLWLKRMTEYAAHGRAYDLEENEDQIRCVAAPVRDVSRKVVAAISVSSAAQYMGDARMAEISADVIETAEAIGRELGWAPPRREAKST